MRDPAIPTIGSSTKQMLGPGEALLIPPGQFGMLLTEESVDIPHDAVGLISIRSSVKFRGLVNVSGFHVDPGFTGRLKFSVYNAGSTNTVLQRGQLIFMLWLCDLDQVTADTYKGERTGQVDISGPDQTMMQGDVASPGQLRNEISELKTAFNIMKGTLAVLITLLIGLLVAVIMLFVRPETPQVTVNLPPAAPPAVTAAAPAGASAAASLLTTPAAAQSTGP